MKQPCLTVQSLTKIYQERNFARNWILLKYKNQQRALITLFKNLIKADLPATYIDPIQNVGWLMQYLISGSAMLYHFAETQTRRIKTRRKKTGRL